MKRILIVLLALLLVGGVVSLYGQAPGRPAPRALQPPAGVGEIRGTVTDADTNGPISAASVAVWSRADSVLVTGAIARADGTFRIQGLRSGIYFLRVSMIGYGSRTTEELTISESSSRADVGRIALSPSAVAIQGVDVTVDRPTMTIAPDRNAYRAKDIAPAAVSATEVLEAVPSVQVDIDGKVSLRGNENVAVQINGRPSPIRGTELAAYLRQLPANTIERVEVVPNPSARYDPEGMAGIINIVLKQNIELGKSGGGTLTASTGNRYNASGNFGLQRGRLTSFLTYGYNWDEREITGINDRTRLGEAGSPLAFTEQDIAGTATNGGHNLNANVDYRLGDKSVLSNALVLNSRGSTNASQSLYSELDGARALLDHYDRIRDTESENWMVDYTLAIKRTLEPQRHELSAELRLNRGADEDRTLHWRQPMAANEEAAPARLEAEINDVDASTYQLTAQGDYTRMLAARTKLETGYKGNARWLDRDYLVRKDPQGTGEWVRGDLSNALELDERVDAVYGVVSHGLGKVDLQGGLRAEYASREFSLVEAGTSFPHSYTSLFPSGLIAYNLTEQSQVKLSYSRRIRRPGVQELNPFPVFFDLQNVFLGNPGLDPEYTDAIELGLQRSGQRGSLQISPFYRRTSNIIRFIVDTDDTVEGREVTSISFKNLDTGTSWGTDVNGSVRLGMFNGMGSFNLFKMVTDGTGGESSLSSDAVTWSGRLNGTFNFPSKTALQAMYFYRAPMNFERGRFSGASIVNLSLRQMLYGDRASVTLRVADPFNTMRMRVELGDDNILQLTERAFGARAAQLSFQYSVGQAPRVRQPRPEQTPAPQTGFP